MGIYIFTPEDLLRYEIVSEECLSVIKDSLVKKEDILIVGGTRTGKTKLVEALTFLIPEEWKIAVITAYNEFKPFKDNIHVINTEFDGRSLESRTEDVIDEIRKINPDYVIIDTIHTVDVPRILETLIGDYGFIVTSLVLSRDLWDEISHWLRISDELLKEFELVIELYRDVKTGHRRVNAIYKIRGNKKLEKLC
ncbi:ATP-binding protein [Pyrococcus sp. ST04]|uniref:ATP-binding protein n=1 Tax=Pyrococcus sp. ST04 TaxID=1183377 RepID=UPI00064E65B3|nr:ATPase, T2SS/T4P/T4SS family [Pyrococcus sp. ST04]